MESFPYSTFVCDNTQYIHVSWFNIYVQFPFLKKKIDICFTLTIVLYVKDDTYYIIIFS
jgi:hypothetical protein